MVTATLAGMILNWSAPVLLVALAALAAAWLGISHEAPGWPVVLAVLGLLTIAALVLYGYLMRTGPETAQFSGDLLGGLAAATALLAIGWLIAAGYHVIPAWIASHGLIAGGLGALAVVGPAVLRFVPVLKTPALRKIALQVLLWMAGLIIPIGALALFYTFWWVGDLSRRFNSRRCSPRLGRDCDFCSQHQPHRTAPALPRPAGGELHPEGNATARRRSN